MKVLRKNDDFKRMPERSVADRKAIDSFISMGWNYSPKRVMKDFYKDSDKPEPKVKEEVVSEKMEKGTVVVEKYSKKKASKK